jgi:hypothetical protein
MNFNLRPDDFDKRFVDRVFLESLRRKPDPPTPMSPDAKVDQLLRLFHNETGRLNATLMHRIAERIGMVYTPERPFIPGWGGVARVGAAVRLDPEQLGRDPGNYVRSELRDTIEALADQMMDSVPPESWQFGCWTSTTDFIRPTGLYEVRLEGHFPVKSGKWPKSDPKLEPTKPVKPGVLVDDIVIP